MQTKDDYQGPPPNSPLGSPPIPIDEFLQAQWESATTLNIHKRKTNWSFYVLHCRLGNKEKVEWIEKFMRGYIAQQQRIDMTDETENLG